MQSKADVPIDVDERLVIDLEGSEYDSDNPQFVKAVLRRDIAQATAQRLQNLHKRKQAVARNIVTGLDGRSTISKPPQAGSPQLKNRVQDHRKTVTPGGSRRHSMGGTPPTAGPSKEVIVLSSSDDDARPPPPKKARKCTTTPNLTQPRSVSTHFAEDAYTSSDCASMYSSGYSGDEEDLSKRERRPARELKLQDIDKSTFTSMNATLVDSVTVPASIRLVHKERGATRPSRLDQVRRPCTSQGTRNTGYAGELFFWEKFKYLRIRDLPVRQYGKLLRNSESTDIRFKSLYDFPERNLIHHSPGAINRAVQCGKHILVASAVSTGMYDEQPDAYNREGTMMYWTGKSAIILHGHRGSVRTNDTETAKFYTVNDVQFDPLRPERFVSAGMDRRVVVWKGAGSRPRALGAVRFDCDPNSLTYKPDSSVLAVEGSNGAVYFYDFHDDQISPHGRWHVAAEDRDQYIADLTWGTGHSANMLFASTSSSDEDIHCGYHKAYDLATMQSCLTFDLKAVGEKVAVDTKGERLAIVAREPASHLLRQYDVRRRRSRATSSIDIDPLDTTDGSDRPVEVNRVLYSPDGLHLALALSNDMIYVYDSRYLKPQPLHCLEHEGPYREGMYGVVEAKWVEEVGLVTGGSDGCVRLWDVTKSGEDLRNGHVIARCDNDIGHFSLGDTAKGEHALVVGECSGHVTTFGHRGSRVHYESQLD